MPFFGRGKVVGVGVAVLLGGVGLQFVPVRDIKAGDRRTPARPMGLAARMPQQIAGWTGRDEPLGATENASTAAATNLNYDDYVFRVFTKPGQSFGVYVAYWGAGRLPIQKAASHTPDRCWTENGWSCLEQRYDVPLQAGTTPLRPAQWRRFQPPGGMSDRPQYVLYWHLVGREQYDYGRRFNARPDLVKWWSDTVRYAFSGSEEQYFIRLTSDRPFEEVWPDSGVQEVLVGLAKLGLAKPGWAQPDATKAKAVLNEGMPRSIRGRRTAPGGIASMSPLAWTPFFLGSTPVKPIRKDRSALPEMTETVRINLTATTNDKLPMTLPCLA